MVTYEDILYPLNLGYGLREIYDIAPWAFDLLIFALVLSAIFKPVMEKLPIFASKKDESHKLAGILSLIFAGSTVYWMQVQNTNLMAASAYIILIMFAILGIFVYSLIASTTFGAKHKVISGVMAFFLTFGLCQAVFGVGNIFTDVFPLFNALLVFLSRILLWVVLITALILLLGRAWNKEGEDGTGGGSPSGTPPSSGGGGAGNFWKKAKEWIPYKLRTPSGKKELDLKKYEKEVNTLEVQIDKASSDAKELDKLLKIQESLVKQFPNFFANLVNNLESIKQYFSRQNMIEGKPLSDVNRWNEQVGEMANVLTSTTPRIEKEFKKLMIDKVAIKDKFSSFDDFRIELNSFPNRLMWKTKSDQKFFQEKDQTVLPKVAQMFQKISVLRTKNEELNVLFAKLNAEYEIMNKTLPANLGEDVVKKMHNLLIGDLNSIHAELDRIITHQKNEKRSQTIDYLLRLLGDNTFNHFNELHKLLKEAITKTANFSIALQEIGSLVDKYKKNIEETDEFSKEAYALSDALYAESKAIEEKERKEAEAKGSKEVQQKGTAEKVKKSKDEQAEKEINKKYSQWVGELSMFIKSLNGVNAGIKDVLSKPEKKSVDAVIKIIKNRITNLDSININFFYLDFKESEALKTEKNNLQKYTARVIKFLEEIKGNFERFKTSSGRESDQRAFEATTSLKLEALNRYLQSYPAELNKLADVLIPEKKKK